MIIYKKIDDIKKHLSRERADGRKIGFVPTMGALHSGHVSLVQQTKAEGLLSVCSIFLNPTQFNDKKDFEKYPVSTEDDIELLVMAGCDVLFLPEVNEIYPTSQEVRTYDFGYLDTVFEGATRPGHFKGVGQVVARLLEIIEPDNLYLGQKDYQQCMVIKKLVEITGMTVNVIVCPTVREADGLAMSSRNRRLTDPQRITSAVIYQCLVSIQSKQFTDQFAIAKKESEELLATKGFVVEYVALASADNLTVLDEYDKSLKMVALIAARIGEIRLIDNILL